MTYSQWGSTKHADCYSDIDVSPTACCVMAGRRREVCRLREDETLWRTSSGFVVLDLPWTEEKLRQFPPFEFEKWIVIALCDIRNKTRNAQAKCWPRSENATGRRSMKQ